VPNPIRDRRHPKPLTRLPRARLVALATLMSGVLVASCGGSSHHLKAATRGGPTGPVTVTTVVTGAAPTVAASSGAALYCQYDPCYTPQQFRVAYGVQPLADRGIDGCGETVTVVTGAASPNCGATDIRRDLEGFDRMFGLPAARIEVVTSLAGSASPWQAAEEEVNDTEIVHAVAPAATLRVVLLPRNLIQSAAKAAADFLAGLRLVVSHTDVASISWSMGEHFWTKAEVAELHSILLGAQAHHVTVIASSGNGGWLSDPHFGMPQVKEVSLPASDPLVLGVGGTTLSANPKTGAYVGEVALAASGGGFSHLYARPAYQDGVRGIAKARGVPDVAGDADEVGGMARVVVSGGQAGLESDPGTSDSAPLWGGLVALADQYAHHDLGSVNSAVYSIARSANYHNAFHDITTGTNGYPATPGWDPVTGWGTPNAQALIPLLARFTSGSKT
jgi:subtilase family serine protease